MTSAREYWQRASLTLISLCTSIPFGSHYAYGQQINRYVPGKECVDLYERVSARAASSSAEEVKRLLSAMPVAGLHEVEPLCGALIFDNMAVRLGGSGRLAEAEALAERSVDMLDEAGLGTETVLFWPLQVLAAIRFAQGKTASAAKVCRRMQGLPAGGPIECAALHELSASLLQARGRHRDAEREYLAALGALTESGHGNAPGAGAVLNSLAVLYIDLHRFEEARSSLDRALAIFDGSREAVSMDYIRVFNSRGALHAAEQDWPQAVQSLRNAVSIADSDIQLNPEVKASLLANYAWALRKDHRRSEARAIEARLNALPLRRTPGVVADVRDLTKRAKRQTR
jgi:tetratricopeptide (TPR) repeat protein